MLSTLFFVLMYCSALTSFLSVFRYHFVCRTLLFCLVQTSCHFLLFFLKHCLIKYSVVFKMEDIVFLCCNQLYPMFSHLSIPFLKFSLNYFLHFVLSEYSVFFASPLRILTGRKHPSAFRQSGRPEEFISTSQNTPPVRFL